MHLYIAIEAGGAARHWSWRAAPPNLRDDTKMVRCWRWCTSSSKTINRFVGTEKWCIFTTYISIYLYLLIYVLSLHIEAYLYMPKAIVAVLVVFLGSTEPVYRLRRTCLSSLKLAEQHATEAGALLRPRRDMVRRWCAAEAGAHVPRRRYACVSETRCDS